MLILGIETSCDETSVAIVEDGKKTLDCNISSQIKTHSEFGGVVPEIAARMHSEALLSLIDLTLKNTGVSLRNIDALAVTSEPGLIGALLVGTSSAKALAYALDKPLIPVNHILGHLYAANLEYEINYPVIGLIISGGHTLLLKADNFTEYKILGSTVDDAAGESFDKVAKMLDLGYPGGPIIEKNALNGNPSAISFPRPMINDNNFNFSFSGLKTSVYLYSQKNIETMNKSDVCASFQSAVFDVLIHKTIQAARTMNIGNIIIGGGVAANKTLKNRFKQTVDADTKIYFPSLNLCADNAAMIAGAAYHLFNSKKFISKDYLCLNPNARSVNKKIFK